MEKTQINIHFYKSLYAILILIIVVCFSCRKNIKTGNSHKLVDSIKTSERAYKWDSNANGKYLLLFSPHIKDTIKYNIANKASLLLVQRRIYTGSLSADVEKGEVYIPDSISKIILNYWINNDKWTRTWVLDFIGGTKEAIDLLYGYSEKRVINGILAYTPGKKLIDRNYKIKENEVSFNSNLYQITPFFPLQNHNVIELISGYVIGVRHDLYYNSLQFYVKSCNYINIKDTNKLKWQ